MESVERTVCQLLADIETIAFQARLPAEEKVRLIQEVLRQRGEEQQSLQGQLTQFKEDLQDECEDRDYYAVLESKSVKLQNKVAGILQHVRFQGNDEPLLEAVRHYQAKEGAITPTRRPPFSVTRNSGCSRRRKVRSESRCTRCCSFSKWRTP